MCCSAWPVSFSGTVTGTTEVLIDGIIKHVIWYQNVVGQDLKRNEESDNNLFNLLVERALEGLSFELYNPAKMAGIEEPDVTEEIQWRKAGNSSRSLRMVQAARAGNSMDGNCLIIPLLSSWESIKLLNTFDTPNLLSNIGDAFNRPQLMPAMAGSFMPTLDASPARIVRLQFDVYDIVIAERANAISQVLPEVEERKRPAVNKEVFDTLDRWYGCPVAVCRFNNFEVFEAKPIAFTFEPTYPDRLCVYTLDGHDGKAPILGSQVVLDHTLFVGSSLMDPTKGLKIEYEESIPEHLAEYVPERFLGGYIQSSIKNGDYVFSTEDVRNGVLNGLRTSPPFAQPMVAPTSFRLN